MLDETPDSNARKRKREGELSAGPLPRASPFTTSDTQSILQGANHFKIENSVLTNIGGDAVIFRFDGDGPLNEEFRSLFAKHVAGVISVQDLDKVEKHIISQSIRNLPRVGAAYNDYTSRDRRRTICFEGTRQALLEEVASWATDPDSPPVYLLSGPAGMGKSTVAQTVSARSDTLRSLGSSFFFSRDNVQRRNAERFFTTMAFQLCSYDSSFAKAIGDALVTDKGTAALSKEPLEQLKELILEPLGPLLQNRSRPVLIVVDALDECEEEDGLIILTGLDHLVQELPSFKVFLTTRPQPHLQYLLDSLVTHKVFHLQNIEEKIVDNDIRLYLKHNLSQSQVKSRLPYIEPWSPDDEELELLVQGAGRLFIIASTAVLFILDKTVLDPQSQMKKLLKAFSRDQTPFNILNNFYTVILRSVVPEDCDPDVVKRYQAVIGAIVVSQEPHPLEALANLTGLPAKSIRAVLLNLQSVISLGDDDGVPRIYHKSFPDFITDPKRCKDIDLLIVPKANHTNTATCCLQVMNTLLRRNILGLTTPARFLDNADALMEENKAESYVREKIPLHLQYACLYWANHVVAGDIRNDSLTAELIPFTDRHLLHWFEALSWIDKLASSRHALPSLVNLKSTSNDMRKIFSDSLLFISMFFETIQQSALHTYYSALPFAPTESALYKRYKKETVDNLCQLEGGLNEWNSLIAILHQSDVHRISPVVFSPDSSRFASWTEEDLKVWDAISGTLIRTFNSVKVALAGDFSVVALLRSGDAVTVYNMATNAPFSTFKHSSKVAALSLSLDGSRLAVGLVDGSVSLWDTEEDKMIAILEGYVPEDDGDVDMNEDEVVNADLDVDTDEDVDWAEETAWTYKITYEDEGVDKDPRATTDVEGSDLDEGIDGDDEGFDHLHRLAFSPGGDRLAFVSNDGIRLWNSTNGKVISNLEHKSEQVAGFTFSHTGSRIASLSKDTLNLRLWNTNDGTYLGIATDAGRTMAISPDGSLLATSDRKDGKVHLWSGDSVSIIDTLEAPSSFLVFGRDLLATASKGPDAPLVLFDAQRREIISKLQIILPASTALSPDGSRLAVGTEFGNIRLWDIPRISASSYEKRPRVTALAFSPRCERLVSGLSDGTTELWDTSHFGRAIANHRIHSDWVTALSFSSEGERFVSGSSDKTVRVWDGEDGSPINSLDHSFISNLISLAISLRKLAVAAAGGITLWDHKTSRIIHTFDQGGDLVSFSRDGSLLVSAKNHRSESASVFMWDVENCSQIAKFTLDSGAEHFFHSPYGSKLVVLSNLGVTTLVDITNMKLVDRDDPEYESLDWIPQINGIPILWLDDCLFGRFSDHHDRVPVLRIPSDVVITANAAGLSMFALGCEDGRIIVIRGSTD